MKKHRRVWFKIIAVLLPFIVLAMIEGMLRLFHYGYDTRLFIPVENDQKFLVMNSAISKKYFTLKENATIGNHDEFYKKKKSGALRFFVMGESSAIGYPYGHNGAFPRMLKYRLQFEYPDKTIEIINLSLTAINSYTVADFAREVADMQPDGILIYAGHNEYYGALGVASTGRFGSNPFVIRAMLYAKNLKIVQWVTNIAASFGKSDKQLTDPNMTLMQRMAAGKEVNYDSESYYAGIKQFDRNMQYMLRIFQEKHIPVFIGTLVSNLGGQKPLGNDKSAQAEFSVGEEFRLKGAIDSARSHFLLAKEYDNLRFRAPEAMNEIIRGYASGFSNAGTVEVQNAFEASSPDSIIGKELITEHVHPNLTGYRLMADAFYKSLKEILPTDTSKISLSISPDDYPLTAFDTIYGDLSIRILKSLWPFNEKLNRSLPDIPESRLAAAYVEKKIRWDEAMKRLYELYIRENNYPQALRILEGMCLEFPHSATFLSQTGKLCLQMEEYEKAYFYLSKYNEISPSPDVSATLERISSILQ